MIAIETDMAQRLYTYSVQNLKRESVLIKETDKIYFVLGVIPGFNHHSSLTLLYRASQDGWEASEFHDKCDGKGATLVVIKTSTGQVCGGYTSVAWSKNTGFKSDSSAAVFSVDNKLKYPCLIHSEAVYHYSSNGPSFGNFLFEIFCDPMNKINCSICSTRPEELARYNVDLDSSGCSILTGQKDSFTCAEIEIYLVTF